MNVRQVRTVLGAIGPAELGVTYVHEHLIIDSPLIEDRWPGIHLPFVEDAVAEVAACRCEGVGAMVDVMPAASGRNVGRLAEISRRTGMHIVACTGLHTSKYYEGHPWALKESSEVLAELFVADIEKGIDTYDYTGPVVRRTSHRAGILKVATLEERPTERERRVFAAAAQTHDVTGVPLLTHCEGGRGAMGQIELFRSLEVPLERIVISHTDKVEDLGYHRDLLETGVNLEYDQALRRAGEKTNATAALLASMVEAGFRDQLMLGTDGARRSLWGTLGGSPGLAWLHTDFVAQLEGLGLTADDLDAVFVQNPAHFLAF
jgi:phosphotriesterase-related protein